MKASRENLVVLRGALAAEPQERTLPTGSVAVQFDVRTALGDAGDGAGRPCRCRGSTRHPPTGRRSKSVRPSSWSGPCAAASSVSPGPRRAGRRSSPKPSCQVGAPGPLVRRLREPSIRWETDPLSDRMPNLPVPNPADRWREVRALREPWRMMAKVGSVARQPRGRGRPVMVIPGFTTTTRPRSRCAPISADWVRAPGWGLGVDSVDVPTQLPQTIERVATGSRERGEPIALVGWSLGGVIAGKSRGFAGHRRAGDHLRHAAVGTPSHHHVDVTPNGFLLGIEERCWPATVRGSCGRSRRSTAATTAWCTGRRASTPTRHGEHRGLEQPHRTRHRPGCVVHRRLDARSPPPMGRPGHPARRRPSQPPLRSLFRSRGSPGRAQLGVKTSTSVASEVPVGGVFDLVDAHRPDEHGTDRIARADGIDHQVDAVLIRHAVRGGRRARSPATARRAPAHRRTLPVRGRATALPVRSDQAEHAVAFHGSEGGGGDRARIAPLEGAVERIDQLLPRGLVVEPVDRLDAQLVGDEFADEGEPVRRYWRISCIRMTFVAIRPADPAAVVTVGDQDVVGGQQRSDRIDPFLVGHPFDDVLARRRP